MLRRKLAVLVAAVLMAVMMLAFAGPAFAQGSDCKEISQVAGPNFRAQILTLFVLTGGPGPEFGQLFAEACSPD